MAPEEFITIAGKMVAFGPAGARSAVSRAYYGAFHLTASLLNEFGCSVPASGVSHAIAPEYLRGSRHPDANAAGRLLSNLHHQRLSADYRLDRPNVEKTKVAMDAVEAARRIQAHLEIFRADCQTDPTIRVDLLTAVEAIKKARQIR